jgi:hypothetical protein
LRGLVVRYVDVERHHSCRNATEMDGAANYKLFNCIRCALGDAVAFPFMMAVNEKREKV